MDTSASSIARVVADLRAGRVKASTSGMETWIEKADFTMLTSGPIVDATAIHKAIMATDKPIRIYEDHPCIAPPWDNAMICYQNTHGNVVAMIVFSVDNDGGNEKRIRLDSKWETAEPIDWNRVRWLTSVSIWLGGTSPELGTIPVTGPMHMYRFAIYEDGSPADMNWLQIVDDICIDTWDVAHVTLLGTLNFLNCRNVDLVEPIRPRAGRRRIARTGVTVSTVNIFPTGRTTRRSKSDKMNQGQGVPLSSVRGHFATYGPEYGRGLLFGKHASRFWIPQHARGSAELGEVIANYVLHTGS